MASEKDDISPTQLLANYLASATPDDLRAAVRREAVRTLFDWVGYAVGGSLER